MRISYTEAPAVETIARELVKQHHSYLTNVRLECVFLASAQHRSS